MSSNQLILVSICLLFIVNASYSLNSCPLHSQEINFQILHQNSISCLQKALKNGWQRVIDYLIQQKQAQYQEQFIFVFEQQIKRLQILEQQIVLGTSETEPILKWGQNKTHLFLTFKLSHRWDSPPCLYTLSQSSQLQTDAFFYNNICLVSHQKINFQVNLTLFKSVWNPKQLQQSKENLSNPNQQVEFDKQNTKNLNESEEESSKIYLEYVFDVKKDGVGQYSTILLKKVPEIWFFLTKEKKFYPTWYQISSRYAEDFKKYEEGLQIYQTLIKQNAVHSTKSSAPQSNGLSLNVILMMILVACVSIIVFYRRSFS